MANAFVFSNIMDQIMDPTAPIKIAAFDLDHTLIASKSGKKITKVKDDFKIIVDVNLIKELILDNFIIIVFTNQKNTFTEDDLRDRMNLVQKAMGIKFSWYAALHDDLRRKPYPTMYHVALEHIMAIRNMYGIDLVHNHSLDAILKLIHPDSFYCGDAAGRDNDFAATDRYFAHNCGLKFITETEFATSKMMSNTYYDIDWSANIGNKDQYTKKLLSIVSKLVVGKHLIVMMGWPGSGKSTTCKSIKTLLETKHLLHNRLPIDTKCAILCQDILRTEKKMVESLHSAVQQSVKCIIIDCLNVKNPTKWIDLLSNVNGKNYISEYECVILHMETSQNIAMYLNKWRYYISDGSVNKVPDIVYNKYKKDYSNIDFTAISDRNIEIITIPFFIERQPPMLL
jgi:bifunctional polynucleotide phosphatase/kinase